MTSSSSTSLRESSDRGPRVRCGWAPRDTWSLDGHLGRVLGGMLDHLAEHTHGWPQGPDLPELTDWHDALRLQAIALLAYEDTIAPAQGALHRVADNLPALWG